MLPPGHLRDAVEDELMQIERINLLPRGVADAAPGTLLDVFPVSRPLG
jgi:hypothetical protein